MALVREIAILLTVQALFASALDDKQKEKEKQEKQAKLPPCAACAALVGSFEAGLARTMRGKFEGGDTAWEEKNLPKGYANSELRLVEIQEKLCGEVKRGELQCHDNHHLWEDRLEEWWKLGGGSDDDDRPDLRQWLCVDRAEACCAEEHFGPSCRPCLVRDSKGKVCGGNGKCKGSGTRKGNGKCSCDTGYAGEPCDACATGFFESYRDDDKLLCSECHKSCQGRCNGSGPKGCVLCRKGYTMHAEHGCRDVDECLESRPCNESQFCVNREGFHQCLGCDKACRSCFADGPDSCDACADGYVLNEDGREADDGHGNGVCVSEEAAGRIFSISNTRYFTYLGLAVAACIISQRSTLAAGSFGAIVAAYIGLSEYYLQGATGGLQPIGTS